MGFADELAEAARAVVSRHFRQPLAVDQKDAAISRMQPVTIADREAEAAIRERIAARYPEHGILGEEHGSTRPDAPWQWIIDPIDGTRAFIAGMPLFGILIGLTYEGEPVLGVVDQPVLDERFVGSAGGATLNGKAIASRPCPRLDDAVMAMTDPVMMASPAQRALYERLRRHAAVTQFGGNCYAYAMLAAGVVDLVVEGDLKPWDICALVPLIEAAGGIITSWDGGPALGSSHILACGDGSLHAALLPRFAAAAPTNG
ncbi:MAG: histidinol-phosphatase [Alphaproteobacteria bacterium]|nr:histidinol-phosphatase [Alphaproteobacteria bacterium]